jgi:DnaJ domain
MSSLIIAFGALGALYYGWHRFQSLDPAGRALLLRRALGGAAISAALGLLATGHVLAAIPFGFFGSLALWRPLFPGSGPMSSGPSARLASVRTAFLEMSLDQASGALAGHVLAGTFTGRELGNLSRKELGQLWQECRAGEAQSRQLLEAYLDRVWPSWRSEMPRSGSSQGAAGPERRNGPMTVQEAYDVLGLSPGAGAEDVKTAHRNLMKRLHPDQGGSNYLAAKINEAKEVLLGKRA